MKSSERTLRLLVREHLAHVMNESSEDDAFINAFERANFKVITPGESSSGLTFGPSVKIEGNNQYGTHISITYQMPLIPDSTMHFLVRRRSGNISELVPADDMGNPDRSYRFPSNVRPPPTAEIEVIARWLRTNLKPLLSGGMLPPRDDSSTSSSGSDEIEPGALVPAMFPSLGMP